MHSTSNFSKQLFDFTQASSNSPKQVWFTSDLWQHLIDMLNIQNFTHTLCLKVADGFMWMGP